jgi:hypothetical protein
MEKLGQIEKAALELIRGAGKYGVYLSQLGFEVAGVADWLELQIPRVRSAVTAVARAAAAEITRPPSAPSDDEQG